MKKSWMQDLGLSHTVPSFQSSSMPALERWASVKELLKTDRAMSLAYQWHPVKHQVAPHAGPPAGGC